MQALLCATAFQHGKSVHGKLQPPNISCLQIKPLPSRAYEFTPAPAAEHRPWQPSHPGHPSATFAGPKRAPPLRQGCGTDAVYGPAAPDYDIWHAKGFAESSRLKEIQPETWGPTAREPRDPHVTPAKCAARSAVKSIPQAFGLRCIAWLRAAK